MTIPRAEYPRPQLVRATWLNLNGTWQFEIDQGDSGLERGLRDRELNSTIIVPFAPESAASGVGNTDFLQAVWYRRTVMIPPEWQGKNLRLHFGAVDHDATVWVNGVEVARHRGGFSSFTAELGSTVSAGEDATIVVRARDLRQEVQARGKQATWYRNTHWQYTRTTGIWQTVWLEAVPSVSIRRLRITPDLAGQRFRLRVVIDGDRTDHRLAVELHDGAAIVAETMIPIDLDLTPQVDLGIPDENLRVWSPDDPFLYDITARLLDDRDEVIDVIHSYAGLRSVALDGRALTLNGKPVFQRLVLDQGYWPDTLMTAPSDDALCADIELAIAAGFNGARLHQKVFEERYYYHADRMGFLVWGEFGDWGVSGQGPTGANQQPTASFVTQWLEVLERDIDHPSIVGWCPLNETHQLLHDRITVLDDVTRAMFLATKLADPTRPVIDASGYSHRVRETDVYDAHSYEQDPSAFAALLDGLADGIPWINRPPEGEYSVPYQGQPYFISEFGGIWWNPDQTAEGDDYASSWGYGQRVADEEEFYSRFDGLVGAIQRAAGIFGYCYTQLTDVFQEQNGIYRFDRSRKLDVDRIRAIQLRPTAYEGDAAAH